MKIDGFFDVAEESSKFYQDVLGFKKGPTMKSVAGLFFWVGNRMDMIVLQQDMRHKKQNFLLDGINVRPSKMKGR